MSNLSGFSRFNIQELIPNHSKITLFCGDVVQNSLDARPTCYYIETGILKVLRHDEYGAEVVLFLIGAGELIINNIDWFSGFYGLSICALTDSTLIPVRPEILTNLLANDITFLSDQLRLQNQYLTIASDRFRKDQSDAISKVLAALAYMASMWPSSDHNIDFVKEIGHQQCAFIANVARETFTRNLIRLKMAGYIHTDEEGRMRLTDKAFQRINRSFGD